MVNKIDRAILELKMDSENIYKNFQRVIERVNVIIQNYIYPDLGNIELLPVKGNVAFGSGKECWGFTLFRFANLYSKKFGIEASKLN